jgi:hypothetical protein
MISFLRSMISWTSVSLNEPMCEMELYEKSEVKLWAKYFIRVGVFLKEHICFLFTIRVVNSDK